MYRHDLAVVACRGDRLKLGRPGGCIGCALASLDEDGTSTKTDRAVCFVAAAESL